MTTAAHYAALAEHRTRLFGLYEGLTLLPRRIEPQRRGPVESTHGYEFHVDGVKAAGSSIGVDEIRLLYEVAQLTEMRSAYCVGVAFGFSTFALALAAPHATVYAIDDFSEHAQLARSHALPLVTRLAGVVPNVALYVGRSPLDTPEALHGLDGPLGLVFIDGEHTDEAATADYRGSIPFMDETTVVLWHDADKVEAAFWAEHGGPQFDTRAMLDTYARMGVFYNSDRHPALHEYMAAATWEVIS